MATKEIFQPNRTSRSNSPEKAEEKDSLYREHRILPRGQGNTRAVTPPPKEKKDTLLPQDTRHVETGGPDGPEPTRYGDWERKGRCVDF